MKLKVIITGATGMVGEGVLIECLNNDNIVSVLVAGRRPCGYSHDKLKEILIKDFYNIEDDERLNGYDSCFFCLGTTSVGKSNEEYFKTTYTLTLNFANVLSRQNPDMTFCYISGAGTNSSEKGGSTWSRVKGKTENDLMKLSFKKVYNFRPALLKPTKEQKHVLNIYKYFGWIYPAVSLLAPNFVSSMRTLALAMINASIQGYEKQILEVKDILKLAKR